MQRSSSPNDVPATIATRGRRSIGCLAFLASLGLTPSVLAQSADTSLEADGTTANDDEVGPELIPPSVKTFVSAEYPKDKKAAGEEGDVTLQLDIDDTGRVTNVEVRDSSDPSFEPPAKAAAQAFVFEPATKNGEAVAARILYRYKFTLEEPELVVDDPGELSGRLVIRGFDAPLANARIELEDENGEQFATKSDVNGGFSFDNLSSGTYRVTITSPGYENLTLDEVVGSGEALEVVYRVTIARQLNEVLIVGERPDEPIREATKRTLTRRQLDRIPGTGGDALKAIQSLPGVARPPFIAGLLIVRGSAPAETGVFVDGVQIPILYHFGGLSSVIPTEMLEKIDFFPSNFSVKYGRLRGSAIDVQLRSPNTECYEYGKETGDMDCYHGFFQLDLIDARTMVSGPIGEEWSFAAAARRSWVDAWIGPALEGGGGTSVTAAPVYYDYQAIVEHTPNAREKLSFRFYGSDDTTELIFDETSNPGAGGQLGLATRFFRGQVLYEGSPSKNIELMGSLSAGWTNNVFSLGPNLDFDFETIPIEYRGEVGWKVADQLTLRTGIDYSVQQFNAKIFAPDPLRPGEQTPGTLVSVRARESNPDQWLHRPALYAEAELRPTNRLMIVPGIRADYTRTTQAAVFSPRGYFRYNIAGPELEERGPWKPRTTLKGGVGVFHQPPEVQETDSVFGTPGIEDTRAVHYSLGFEQEITEQIELGLEGYYKDYQNLVSRRPDERGDFTYNNEGDGYVVGAELLLQYKPDDVFFGWLAYSLSRSVRRDLPELEERLFEFDQTHNLTALGSVRLGAGWEMGARFRLISGNPFTPYQDRVPAIFAADGTEYVPINGEPYSDRLPIHHQLDLRLDKKWQFQAWSLAAYLDVQNVYNRRARESISYNYNFTQQDFQLGLPILPSIGVRGEF